MNDIFNFESITLTILTKKWNESGFRPPLCTYRLNWARRTSWGWWDEWDDTVLQTQDLKFEPWRSEAEHAASRSRRLPTILTFTRGWGRNIFVSLKPPRPGTEPRTLAWKAANHYLRAPALQSLQSDWLTDGHTDWRTLQVILFKVVQCVVAYWAAEAITERSLDHVDTA